MAASSLISIAALIFANLIAIKIGLDITLHVRSHRKKRVKD